MKKILIAAITIFIAVNFFLLLKEDSKASRSYYVKKWSSATEQKLVDTIPAEGFTTPLEEQHVYYDEDKGSFAGFGVEKGDEVSVGATLFYYSTSSYEEAKSTLELERDSLQKQWDGFQEKVSQLNMLIGERMVFSELEEEKVILSDQSVEVEIAETKAEMERVQSEIDKVDGMIVSIDEQQLPYLEEISDIDGFVKEIQHSLSNPVVTIASNEPRIDGVLSREERADIEPGMKVLVSLKNSNKTYDGSVGKVANYPEKEPSVGEESLYPFSVVLNEPMTGVVHGSQVEVKFVTAEIPDAVTVPFQAVHGKGKEVFVLKNGKVERREVTLGVKINNTQQVESGLEAGEIVSRESVRFGEKPPTFFTPLQIKKWHSDMFKDTRKLEIIKKIGKGFLS